MSAIPMPEHRPIAVRAYAEPEQSGLSHWKGAGPRPEPSNLTLIFDTETKVDAAQQLRFGSYELRKGDDLLECGLFYDPLSLTGDDRATLSSFAEERSLQVRTTEEWIEEVFFGIAYEMQAIYVGFNLPFDLSRLAIAHAAARGKAMRGGFTFRLSEDRRWPRVQVKHLNRRSALIRFTAPRRQRTPRGMRRLRLTVPVRRGHFVDVKSLAAALTSQSHDLASIARLLQTPHQKIETDEHGGPLTPEYLAYALNDVHVTWECFRALRERYESLGLKSTPVSAIYSEASIGKAHLREMGVEPWREVQSDCPPERLGIMLSTYDGGRAEVHLRRTVTRVLYCDFLSMYPTVCTLMGLWRFVIARGVDVQDATDDARALLERVSLEDLQRPETWQELRCLVQIQPDEDMLPVRARYGWDRHYTIGLNYLTSDRPLWYTLADCIVSKLQTGRAPKVIRALRFRPRGMQQGLRPIHVAGNPAFRVDPRKDDFYKRLVELRSQVRATKATANAAGDTQRAAELEAEQQALKITANATSYGIFMELNVAEFSKPAPVSCYGWNGVAFGTDPVSSMEEPGRYFHPLLATLITGAARLMLAIAERLVADAGLTWAFCDTDSLALAKPDGMTEDEFLARSERVRQWFRPLNPYETGHDLLRLEDPNFRLDGDRVTDRKEPLFCYPISAKRYALFNIDDRGRPVLRKASGHGLGHLLAPYGEDDAPASIPPPRVTREQLGVSRWEHDLWYRIIEAALRGDPIHVRLDDLPGFDKRAVSQYAATTPTLLRWFRAYNRGKPYCKQVRPFGFLLAFQSATLAERWPSVTSISSNLGTGGRKPTKRLDDVTRAVAPFDRDPGAAAQHAFDRNTGGPVPGEWLRTYRQALRRYHMHPEAKFLNASYMDAGPTRRRHIFATAIEHIGKEANRWEERLHLGEDPEAEIEYGLAPQDRDALLDMLRQQCASHPLRDIACVAGLSEDAVGSFRQGRGTPNPATVARLRQAIGQLQREREKAQLMLAVVRSHCEQEGLREFARRVGIHPGHLSEALAGRRRPSRAMLRTLAVTIACGSPQ